MQPVIELPQVKPSLKWPLLVLALVVLSSLALIYSIFQARNLTSEMQALRAEQNRLNEEWGQLQLENSTWGAYARVEQMAVGQLGMRAPTASQRVVVTP